MKKRVKRIPKTEDIHQKLRALRRKPSYLSTSCKTKKSFEKRYVHPFAAIESVLLMTKEIMYTTTPLNSL